MKEVKKTHESDFILFVKSRWYNGGSVANKESFSFKTCFIVKKGNGDRRVERRGEEEARKEAQLGVRCYETIRKWEKEEKNFSTELE